jgi:RND family efflux transporter MFP subunit
MKKSLILLITSIITFPAFADSTVAVTTQSAEQLSFYPVKSAPAKVVSLNHAKIPAQVSGIVTHMNHRVGDKVSQGDVIAKLDCVDIKLTLARLESDTGQSEIELAFNQRELNRTVKLDKQQSVSEAELDQQKTNVRINQSRLKSLKISLKQQQVNADRCDIKAPFEGIVTKRMASVGEQLNQGQTVVELLQSGQQEVSVQIALSDQHAFTQARAYWLEVNDHKYPLRLRQLIPLVIDNSRSLESRLEFVNKTTFNGVTGRVKWHTPTLYLPAYLLLKRQGKYGFFINDNKTAKFIVVEGALEGRPIKLDSAQNYSIIIDGRFALKDSQTVTIKPTDTTTLLKKKEG